MNDRVVDDFMGPGDVESAAVFTLFLLPAQGSAQGGQLPAENTVVLQAQLRQRTVDLARVQAGVIAAHGGGGNALVGLDGRQQRVLFQALWPDYVTPETAAVLETAALEFALGRQHPGVAGALYPAVVPEDGKQLLRGNLELSCQRGGGEPVVFRLHQRGAGTSSR